MRRVRLAAPTVIVVMAALLAGPVPGSPRSVAAWANDAQPQNALSDPAWLQEINLYRGASGLALVAEEPAWSNAIMLHLTYLAYTPAQYRTGQYASPHSENPTSPYYTAEGAHAGAVSLLISGGFFDAKSNIDLWLGAPYHGAGMFSPQLTKVAYAYLLGYVGLNVGDGLDWTVENPTDVIVFPGAGMTTNLYAFSGNETPNPLAACGWPEPGWGDEPVGLPLIILTTAEPSLSLSATLVAGDGPDFSTADGSLCVVDVAHPSGQASSLVNSPAVSPSPGARSILSVAVQSGGYYEIFLLPRRGLTFSRYRATVTQSGQAPISWSFVVAPPFGVGPKKPLVLHVTDSGADTVMGNLTVTGPDGVGYTTAYPCLNGRPNASNNNYVANQTIPNFVAVHPDANGDICLYTHAYANIIWDQVVETDAFTAHNAVRMLDTRAGSKPANGAVKRLHVTSSGADTVLGNLTVTQPAGPGYTTVYPCLAGRPNASNNNYVTNQTIPNFVAAHPDANGDICIYTSRSAHLIWDQVTETDAFTAHNAVRVYDTRFPRSFY